MPDLDAAPILDAVASDPRLRVTRNSSPGRAGQYWRTGGTVRTSSGDEP